MRYLFYILLLFPSFLLSQKEYYHIDSVSVHTAGKYAYFFPEKIDTLAYLNPHRIVLMKHYDGESMIMVWPNPEWLQQKNLDVIEVMSKMVFLSAIDNERIMYVWKTDTPLGELVCPIFTIMNYY